MAETNHPASSLIAQFGKYVLPWVGDDPERAGSARRAMQDLVAGKYPDARSALPPVLQAQVDGVAAFLGVYGGGQPGFRPQDIPAPLAGVPEGEQLLAVYLPDHGGQQGFFRSLDAWFDFAGRERPAWRNPDLKSDPACVRLRSKYRPGIRWVRFSKNHDAGKSATYSRQRTTDLAGLESLMAASLIDGYVDGWFRDGNVAPNLSALEVSLDGGSSWGYVPFLSRWRAGGLRLSVGSADYADPDWGSPRVLEC